MTDASPLFIDTNILVYANIFESPFHQQARQSLEKAYQQSRPLWISRQVLREYLAIMTRPQSFQIPLDKKTVIQRIHYFQNQFNIANDTATVTDELLQLLNHFEIGGKQIHDANIVATMQVNHISHLLTYNVSDFKRFATIIQIESI